MKQSILDNIRQLDISTGGGLVLEKIRIDTINHPALIIGIGGTGIDALLRLKYMINRRFKLPDNFMTKQKKQKPDNIEFLAFETNEHDKKKYMGIGLDPHQELVLLANAGIASILNNPSTMPDYIREWLSPELTITDGTKGASGNRQAGRLLLFEKINTAIDAISGKIRNLRMDQENKLLVFILTGLSGGTGGGMFLDIAYIIRGLMERDFGNKGIDKVEINGYLFMPDIHMAGNNLNVYTEEYIQRNGYAALKELDYWMNLEERPGERFRQRYGTRLTVNSGLAPFNLCHLISGTNIDGVFMKGAYDYCLNVTAENIVNFLAQEEKTSEGEFAIQDYYNNLLSNIATMKSSLPAGLHHQANFIYNIIGASSAALPTLEISAYLACRLFKELPFDIFPDEYNLSEFISAAKLDIDNLGNELSQGLPLIKLDYEGTDYYSYQNVIKTRRVNVEDKLNNLYLQAKRGLKERVTQLTSAVINNAKDLLKELFVKHGASFTTRLLESDRNPCVLALLETYRDELYDKAAKLDEEIEVISLSGANRFEDAVKAVLFSKESKKNIYIETQIRAYQARLEKDVLSQLANMYKEIITELEAENDKVYRVYNEVLTEIRRIMDKNAAILDSGPQEERAYSWSILTTGAIAPAMEELINRDNLATDLAKHLLAEPSKWLEDGKTDIPLALSDFIYETFSPLLGKTMEEYLAMCYGPNREPWQIVESDIATRLYRDAKPVFHLDNSAGMYNFPSFGLVSVPDNAPLVWRGIEAYQGHSLANLRFNIKKSPITDRIFWLNTQNGIPLYAYAPIRVYEELYEGTIFEREGVGRHLVMNDRENWVNLPSPIPEAVWGDTYNNPRQKELNNVNRASFYAGLKNGSIKEEARPGGSRFIYIETNDEKLIVDETRGNLQNLNDLREKGFDKVSERQLRGVGLAQTVEIFLRSPKLVRLVELENKKYAALNELWDKISNSLSAQGQEKNQMDDFLHALVFEIIHKKGAAYLYNKELEEDHWPVFANLLEYPEYPEFIMFSRYKELPPTKTEHIKKRVKALEAHVQGSRLILALKKWQGVFASRKDELDKDNWPWERSADMHDFYRNMLTRVNARISAIEG